MFGEGLKDVPNDTVGQSAEFGEDDRLGFGSEL